MHILEGYLPLSHAIGWSALAAPSVVHGYRSLTRPSVVGRDARFALAASVAFLFLLTALKIPSVAGSSSHPTGTALGTLLVGAPVMAVASALVLLLQAILLAHGGITTLGANVFALGIVGPWATVLTLGLLRRVRVPVVVAVAASALVGDLTTYLATSMQLALAHPVAGDGVLSAFLRFASVFGVTQLPIAALEALLTVLVVRALPTEAIAAARYGDAIRDLIVSRPATMARAHTAVTPP